MLAISEMVNFNSAHYELSIEVPFFALVLLKANFFKVALKKASFYAFIRLYSAESGRKIPEMANFKSAHYEFSIEVRFIALVLLEPNVLKVALKKAYFYERSKFRAG